MKTLNVLVQVRGRKDNRTYWEEVVAVEKVDGTHFAYATIAGSRVEIYINSGWYDETAIAVRVRAVTMSLMEGSPNHAPSNVLVELNARLRNLPHGYVIDSVVF